MARRTWFVAGLAAISIFALPAAAMAYTPPEEPDIEVLDDPSDIVPGEPVEVRVDNFLPGSAAVFTVAADGVDGDDIGLTVLGSRSTDATVGTDGSFTVSVVFPEAATYTLTASGLDLDGNPTSVSTTLVVSVEGGLPGTGFGGRDVAVGGVALMAAGIAALVLARRRTSVAA